MRKHVLLYGLLLTYAFRIAPTWRWHVLASLATALVVLLVGFASMYLRIDYMSDVLGAVAEGVAWLALCHTGVETLRRSRMGP